MAREIKTREIVIGVQSVRKIPVTVTEQGPGETIGQVVDSILRSHREDGFHPNKLVIDLSPSTDRPERLE